MVFKSSINQGGGGGGYVPYVGATGPVDLNNQNLTNVNNFGLNGEIDFSGNVDISAKHLAIGATTFTGSGTNDITLTGGYTGASTPTYEFTITTNTNRILSLNSPTGAVNVGDSVRLTRSGRPTINTTAVFVATVSGNIYVGVPISNSINGYSFTDLTTGATAGLNSYSLCDAGTFTDGTTSITNFPLYSISLGNINGIQPSAGTITGHTIGDFWTATVAHTVVPVFTSSNSAGVIFPQSPLLAGGSAGAVVGLDSSGNMSIYYPVGIGSPVNEGSPTSVLFLDSSGNIADTSLFTYDAMGKIYTCLIGTSYTLMNGNAGSSTGLFGINGIQYISASESSTNLLLGNTVASTDILEINWGTSINNFITNGSFGITDSSGHALQYTSVAGDYAQYGDISGVGGGDHMTINWGSSTNGFNTSGSFGFYNPGTGVPQLLIDIAGGNTTINNVPVYANDAAATTGGLSSGMLYKTTLLGTTSLNIVP